ncbi:hypothetical protein KUW19_00235 [Ferrimonas balearica]|uniref:hypothetical protein n=1 Tax=Ferrimonas balearica TaxID=44012 RepID=UPI001C970F17|nr:hypothetical protein [Ferrimonas balearica]MBY6104909.1 hypothetical protein [Ferrimonas balearica]
MIDLTDYDWEEIALTQEAPQYEADTLSLKRLVRSQGRQRLRLELSSGLIPAGDARGLRARFNRARRLGSCRFIHPIESYTRGTDPRDLVLGASALAGADTLTVTSPSHWQLRAGDYIQLEGHSKAYEIAEDTLLITGQQQVVLTHALVRDAVVGEGVSAHGVAFVLVPDGEPAGLEMDGNDGPMASLTLAFVEKL